MDDAFVIATAMTDGTDICPWSAFGLIGNLDICLTREHAMEMILILMVELKEME